MSSRQWTGRGRDGPRERGIGTRAGKPPLRLMPTTLWSYPSQHYDAYVDETGRVVPSRFAGGTQGSKHYVGATPSWVIWQCLMRSTKAGDRVLDPMCGSGTTLDVCADLGRVGTGFDLAPSRPDIQQGDARRLPVKAGEFDFVFVDPPYSTHVDYSDDPRCIGKLTTGGEDDGAAYYEAMGEVLRQVRRALRPGGVMGLYVSDSFRKRRGKSGGVFMPIGFRLLAMISELFEIVDVICVVRENQKLERGNWRAAAEEGNYFLRGFNYLFLARREGTEAR